MAYDVNRAAKSPLQAAVVIQSSAVIASGSAAISYCPVIASEGEAIQVKQRFYTNLKFMAKEKQKKKKAENNYQSIYSRMLPAFFVLLSFLLMVLPLQKPVNSARAVLSYVFIPQLRTAHATAQYLNGVSDAVDSLINVAAENQDLKAAIAELKIENAQVNVLRADNERLGTP